MKTLKIFIGLALLVCLSGCSKDGYEINFGEFPKNQIYCVGNKDYELRIATDNPLITSEGKILYPAYFEEVTNEKPQ